MKIFSSVKNILIRKIILIEKDEQNSMSIDKLKKEIDKYKKISKKHNKYLILATKWALEQLLSVDDDFNRKLLFDVYKAWDDIGYISLDDGEYIEYLSSIATAGIYHLDSNIDNNDVINSEVITGIMQNGLRDIGDTTKGIMYTFNRKIFHIKNPLDIVMNLKGTYQKSNGKILLAFRKDVVDENMEFIYSSSFKLDEVYGYIDNISYIRTMHIAGYYASDNNVCTFYGKEQFTQKKKYLVY